MSKGIVIKLLEKYGQRISLDEFITYSKCNNQYVGRRPQIEEMIIILGLHTFMSLTHVVCLIKHSCRIS